MLERLLSSNAPDYSAKDTQLHTHIIIYNYMLGISVLQDYSYLFIVTKPKMLF